MIKKSIFTLCLLVSGLLFLAACTSPEATPVPTSAPVEARSTPTNAAPATAVPTEKPAVTDTVEPTDEPTEAPTDKPTAVPTDTPEAVTATPETTAQTLPYFEADDCQFDEPQGYLVDCGYVTVAEEHANPDNGRTIRLHVAIFHSESENPAADPVIYLDGGPGGDSLETVPYAFASRFSPFLADRDFIMFDQRGTGYSEPSLACGEYTDLVLETLDQNLTPAEENKLSMETFNKCHDRLADEGVNFAAFNSLENAADVADIRVALGYEEWNLYGISYGTRLAQTVMRDHPEGVRSVILDSSYPLSADLVQETPDNMARAFSVFFAGCAKDPVCNEAYPDLETVFYDLVAQLDKEPITFEVRYFITGDKYTALMNGRGLIGTLFQSLYSAEIIPSLPQMIFDTRDGDYTLISSLTTNFLANTEFFSVGMQFSVQCNEEVSFSDPEAVAEAVAAHPEIQEYYETGTDASDDMFLVCAMWDAGTADPIENEAITSDLPTLIMAGEYDPITPPAWGQLVGEGLSNHFYFEFPGLGHGASISGDCPLSVAMAFLNDPSTEPNGSCIAEMSPPAFEVPGAPPEEVTLVEFSTDIGIAKINGLAPEGWEDTNGIGLFARMKTGLDATFVLEQAAPGVTPEMFLSLLTGQLGLAETPEKSGEYEDANGRLWTLYTGDLQGSDLDIALAQDDDGITYVVILSADPDEHEFYYKTLLLPVLDAIQASE